MSETADIETGKALFDRIVETGWDAAVGSDHWNYAQTLRSARLVVSDAQVYDTLNQAQATGQRIEIVDNSPAGAYGYANGITLVPIPFALLGHGNGSVH